MADKDPYELTRYIEREFESIRNNNACEHRPTYMSELQLEEKRIRELFLAGIDVQNQISQEDKNRCANLYKVKVGNYGAHELIRHRVMNQYVLVPRYIAWYDEMIKLKGAIA